MLVGIMCRLCVPVAFTDIIPQQDIPNFVDTWPVMSMQHLLGCMVCVENRKCNPPFPPESPGVGRTQGSIRH